MHRGFEERWKKKNEDEEKKEENVGRALYDLLALRPTFGERMSLSKRKALIFLIAS